MPNPHAPYPPRSRPKPPASSTAARSPSPRLGYSTKRAKSVRHEVASHEWSRKKGCSQASVQCLFPPPHASLVTDLPRSGTTPRTIRVSQHRNLTDTSFHYPGLMRSRKNLTLGPSPSQWRGMTRGKCRGVRGTSRSFDGCSPSPSRVPSGQVRGGWGVRLPRRRGERISPASTDQGRSRSVVSGSATDWPVRAERSAAWQSSTAARPSAPVTSGG